jgi:multiple sugar transport system ATP-binding protein
MVFQSYALYPQMTVEGNLSFGLKTAKVCRKAEIVAASSARRRASCRSSRC